MKHLDLFSGIGGFALAARWTAAIETVGFCEIDTYCQRNLNKNFPGIPVHDDIKTLRGDEFGKIDIITGGFPCQDISVAGKGAGITGARSGLWREMHRVIGVVRPSYVIVENVANLLGRGIGVILQDLSAIGYDAEWEIVPAATVGALHLRERVWIIAYPSGVGLKTWHGAFGNVARQPLLDRYYSGYVWKKWGAEPLVGGRIHGIPHRVDRIRALGNSIVPQIAYILMKQILDSIE